MNEKKNYYLIIKNILKEIGKKNLGRVPEYLL